MTHLDHLKLIICEQIQATKDAELLDLILKLLLHEAA